jgi:hypothetical protein
VTQAKLVRRRKWTDELGNLYEIVLWRVKQSAQYPEGVRYRLAFIRSEHPLCFTTTITPKGHHRHVGMFQEPYNFVTAQQLVADFLSQASTLAKEIK